MSDKEITAFVKKNLSNKKNIKVSSQEDGTLYHKGRILTTKKINACCELSTIIKDLGSNTLCVPVIYKYSPLAYSIVNEIQCHSDAVKHSGVETVWRYVLKLGYITQNRDLVKEVKKNCERCRYLRKKAISIKMGLVSTHNLRIAPAFYATEVDLCGPFKAHSPKSKRKTIKIWLAVYCCMSASTTLIKAMKDYSITAFIQSFVRFSCDVGYAKLIKTMLAAPVILGGLKNFRPK